MTLKREHSSDGLQDQAGRPEGVSGTSRRQTNGSNCEHTHRKKQKTKTRSTICYSLFVQALTACCYQLPAGMSRVSASSCLLQLCLLIPNSPNQYRFTRLQRRVLLKHLSLARAALLNTNIPLRRIIRAAQRCNIKFLEEKRQGKEEGAIMKVTLTSVAVASLLP